MRSYTLVATWLFVFSVLRIAVSAAERDAVRETTLPVVLISVGDNGGLLETGCVIHIEDPDGHTLLSHGPDRTPVPGAKESYTVQLPAGRYRASATVPLCAEPGRTVFGLDMPLEVKPGAVAASISLRFKGYLVVRYVGRLETSEGQPVAGAAVALAWAEGARPAGAYARTGEDGRFTLGLLAGRRYSFQFWAPPSEPAAIHIRGGREEFRGIAVAQRESATHLFRLQPNPVSVRVKFVLDRTEGLPPPAAPSTVLCEALEGDRSYTPMLDRGSGEYVACTLPPGKYRLRIGGDDYEGRNLMEVEGGRELEVREGAPPVERTLHVRPRRKLPLAVEVVAEGEGKSVGGARVRLSAAGGYGASASTDESGVARFTEVPEGEVTVSVNHRKFARASVTATSPWPEPVRLSLETLPVFTGQLVSGTIRDFSGFQIVVASMERNREVWGRAQDNGVFSIPYEHPTGPALIVIQEIHSEKFEGSALVGWAIVDDHTTSCKIEVEPSVEVVGTVHYEGILHDVLGAERVVVGLAPAKIPHLPIIQGVLRPDNTFTLRAKPGKYVAYLLWKGPEGKPRQMLRLNEVAVSAEGNEVRLNVSSTEGSVPAPNLLR